LVFGLEEMLLKKVQIKIYQVSSKTTPTIFFYFEVVLMTLFLLMNATDLHLQNVPGVFLIL
jgi:hypothetical protein